MLVDIPVHTARQCEASRDAVLLALAQHFELDLLPGPVLIIALQSFVNSFELRWPVHEVSQPIRSQQGSGEAGWLLNSHPFMNKFAVFVAVRMVRVLTLRCGRSCGG